MMRRNQQTPPNQYSPTMSNDHTHGSHEHHAEKKDGGHDHHGHSAMIEFIKSELGLMQGKVQEFDRNHKDVLRQVESVDRKIGSTR